MSSQSRATMPTRFLILPCVLALACASEKASSGGDSADPDAALAATLWDQIGQFEDWSHPDGWDGVVESVDGTHGPYVEIWASPETMDAWSSDTPVPDGSIVVKCGYQDDEGAAPASAGHALTAMMKVEGYAPDAGDWFWAKFDPTTGAAEVAGTGNYCSSCHGAADQDGDWFLFDEEHRAD